MHDLTCLVEHLHLFLRVIVIHHLVNLWDDVICKLMWELVDGLYFACLHKFFILLYQLFHGCSTCT